MLASQSHLCMHFESDFSAMAFSVTDKVYRWFIIIYSGMYDEQGRILVGRITTYIYWMTFNPNVCHIQYV